MDDAGNYMVKAINIEGEAKCESVLNILPSVTNIPMANEPMNIQPPVANIPMTNRPINILPPVTKISSMTNESINILPSVTNVPMTNRPINILPSVTNIPMANESINIQPTGFPPEFLQLFTDQQASLNSTIRIEARLIGTQPLAVKIPMELFSSKIDFCVFFSFRFIGYLMVHQSICKITLVINNKFSMIYIP